ncbi:MAG: ATP-binding protein [Acidobacteriota bacterium]
MSKVTLSLPMEPDFELVATDMASALAGLKDFPSDKIDEIKMAVIEACINAFEHSQSRDRKITVSIDPRPDRLIIVISDRGHGFGIDPAAAGPRELPSGRRRGFGLRIIKAMMDDVKVESDDRGTRIVMVKKKE